MNAERICANPKCGRAFIPKDRRAKYHDRACGLNAWRDRQPNGAYLNGSEGGYASAEARKKAAAQKYRDQVIALGPGTAREIALRVEALKLGFKWGYSVCYHKHKRRPHLKRRAQEAA